MFIAHSLEGLNTECNVLFALDGNSLSKSNVSTVACSLSQSKLNKHKRTPLDRLYWLV